MFVKLTNQKIFKCCKKVKTDIAFWMYLAITSLFGHGLPTYVLFYPAIIILALLAGFGPGVLATIISVMLAGIWLIQPIGQFSISLPVDEIEAAIFTFFGVPISDLSELYCRNRNKAAQYTRKNL